MMIRKLNANKSIHFHHRSFQAKPTLTQKKISIVSLALFKCKKETQRETWHNTLKLQMKKTTIIQNWCTTHTLTQPANSSNSFNTLDFFRFGIVLEKWILVRNFHATNRQFHGFRIGFGIALTTKQTQTKRYETKQTWIERDLHLLLQ